MGWGAVLCKLCLMRAAVYIHTSHVRSAGASGRTQLASSTCKHRFWQDNNHVQLTRCGGVCAVWAADAEESNRHDDQQAAAQSICRGRGCCVDLSRCNLPSSAADGYSNTLARYQCWVGHPVKTGYGAGNADSRCARGCASMLSMCSVGHGDPWHLVGCELAKHFFGSQTNQLSWMGGECEDIQANHE